MIFFFVKKDSHNKHGTEICADFGGSLCFSFLGFEQCEHNFERWQRKKRLKCRCKYQFKSTFHSNLKNIFFQKRTRVLCFQFFRSFSFYFCRFQSRANQSRTCTCPIFASTRSHSALSGQRSR